MEPAFKMEFIPNSEANAPVGKITIGRQFTLYCTVCDRGIEDGEIDKHRAASHTEPLPETP